MLVPAYAYIRWGKICKITLKEVKIMTDPLGCLLLIILILIIIGKLLPLNKSRRDFTKCKVMKSSSKDILIFDKLKSRKKEDKSEFAYKKLPRKRIQVDK